MEIRPKKLSIIQLVGYEGDLEAVPTNQICHLMYDLGQEFIDEMMDTVYSDGPVYFKSHPFSETANQLLFTTFGNGISPTGEDTGPLIFNEKILVDSDDFASFLPEDLQTYYDFLASKYSDKDLENLAVYHVLYYNGSRLVVDAYGSWEE